MQKSLSGDSATQSITVQILVPHKHGGNKHVLKMNLNEYFGRFSDVGYAADLTPRQSFYNSRNNKILWNDNDRANWNDTSKNEKNCKPKIKNCTPTHIRLYCIPFCLVFIFTSFTFHIRLAALCKRVKIVFSDHVQTYIVHTIEGYSQLKFVIDKILTNYFALNLIWMKTRSICSHGKWQCWSFMKNVRKHNGKLVSFGTY